MHYNGVEVRTVHQSISIAKEIPPGMAERELRTFAVKDGERLVGADVQQAEYIAKINIAGKSRAEAWQVRSLLAAWATSAGDKVTQLIPTHWPQVAYDAICTKISAPEFVFSHGTVEVTFACPCPYAYSLTASTATGAKTASVTIGGSAPARPVITYTPGITANGLTLALDDVVFLTIQGEVAANTAIQFDTGTGALLIAGAHAESRINYTESTMRPDFSPGAHTLEASKSGSLQVRWNNRWR